MILSYFLIAAVIDSYKKISLNFDNQKYLARSTLLYENIHAFNRKAVEKTPFIIQIKGEEQDSYKKANEMEVLSKNIEQSV